MNMQKNQAAELLSKSMTYWKNVQYGQWKKRLGIMYHIFKPSDIIFLQNSLLNFPYANHIVFSDIQLPVMELSNVLIINPNNRFEYYGEVSIFYGQDSKHEYALESGLSGVQFIKTEKQFINAIMKYGKNRDMIHRVENFEKTRNLLTKMAK